MSNPPSVEDWLFQEPYRFDFFQAVKLLILKSPDRATLGGLSAPADETVRFKVHQSLLFAPSSISDLSSAGEPPTMSVSFFGLTGVQGLLPHFYTEHILERAKAKDLAMAEFFDLFNHRVISLFYKAWEKHRSPVRHQIAVVTKRPDDTSQYLFDLIGLGTSKLRDRLQVSDEGLLPYSGLFSQMPRSAVNLRAILSDYFGVPVEIDQFQGAWYSLAEEDRSNLNEEGPKNRLGEGAIAGDAIWDPQARIRIKVGPLTLERFLSYLPESDALNQLNDLTRFYLGPVTQYELQLILSGDQIPSCRLGDDTANGPRPGYCAWLDRDRLGPDAGDVVFDLSATSYALSQ